MGRDARLNPFPGMHIPIIGQDKPAQVLDVMGRALQPGDFVMLPQSHPQFEVVKIEPAETQPGGPPLPPGLLTVTVRCQLGLQAIPGAAVWEIVRTMTKAEREEAKP